MSQQESPAPLPLLYKLLGDDAVLLPLAVGRKTPIVKAWQKLTFAETRTPAYQAQLRVGNVGVSLGEPSNGLCSIDCDSDETLAKFLDLNPKLKETLITSAKRGGNVWVKITGQYPSLRTFKDFGEWRSTGGQTVVWGIHPDGPRYRFVNEAPVVKTSFENIKWPNGISFERKKQNQLPKTDSSVSSVSESTFYIPTSTSYTTTSLHNSSFDDVISRVEKFTEVSAREERWMHDPKNERIAPLYRDLVLRSAEADTGQRNAAVVAMGKRLSYAVAPSVALELLIAFYEINAPLFKDSAEQHRREVEAMLINVETTYLTELSADERQLYEKLPERLRPPFRICRDLAMRQDIRTRPGEFFMSADNFGRRLGLTCTEGHRILKRFVKFGVLGIVTLGKRRVEGQQATATLYRWRFPLGLAPALSDSPTDPTPDCEPFDEWSESVSDQNWPVSCEEDGGEELLEG